MDNKDQKPSIGERFSAAVAALRDPNGQKDIRDGVVAEARSAAELLKKATNNPEQIVEQAQAKVAIVVDTSTQLQAMVDDKVNMPDLSKVKALASTAEAAGKALNAQEAALKSAKDAFDKSNPDLSKAEAVSDHAKDADSKKLTDIVTKGNEAMAAIAPAREVLYQMWLQDCQAVADVIAGKKKPEDIRKPVVHTLMGALDAYSKNKDKFKLDDPQKKLLNETVVKVRAVTDTKSTEPDKFTFDEAEYNEARAKKAVIDRDSAPVTLRKDQEDKIEQKKKIDDAITAVAAEKTKLGEAQGEVEEKRNELVKRVEKDATAAFDKVQQMIEGLSKAADETDPGNVLDAKARREKLKEVTDAWATVLKQFKEAYPERAEEVRKNLADLADKLTKKEQSEKSGKSTPLDFHRLFAIWDGIRHSEAVKFVGGIVRSVLPRREGANQDAKREAAEVVDSELAAKAWADGLRTKFNLLGMGRVNTAYETLNDTEKVDFDKLFKPFADILFSDAIRTQLDDLIKSCEDSKDKLPAYTAHHAALEALFTKVEAYAEKAEEIALALNIDHVDKMIADLTAQADETDPQTKLTPQQIKDRYNEVVGVWRDLINKNNTIDTQKYKEINEKIAALEKKLFPKAPIDVRKGFSNIPNRIKGIADRIIPNQIAEAIADVIIPNESLKNIQLDSKATNVERVASASEYAASTEDEAKQQLKLIREKGQRDYYRMGFAYRSVHEDMRGEFDKQLDTAQILTMDDRFKFHELLDLCEAAQDVLVPYNANRAELIVLLQKTQAYAEKAEAIAQELNAERLDPAEKARIALTELTAKKTDFLSRHQRALESVAKDKQDEFTRRINIVMNHPDTDRFSKLMQICQQAQDKASAYYAHRAELEGIVAQLKAYAEESERIARELNATATNTAGNRAEGGAGAAPEQANASEAMAWLKQIRERCNGFLGAPNRARESVKNKSALTQFDKELKAYEDSQGGPITYGALEARLSGFEKNNNPLQYYRNHHQEIEAMVVAYARYIEQAKAIAERLNTEQSPAGGAAGEPAPGPRSEATGNNSEARANTKELQDWLDITRIKVVDIARRSSLMLDSMSSDKREEFKKSDIYTRYKTPYDAAEKIFSDVQFKFNEGTDEFYPTAREFNDARVRVGPLLAECEKNLVAAEAEVERRKAEQNEGDKPADKVEAQRWSTSTRPKLQKLYDMIEEIKTSLSGEALSQFSRSPEAKALNNAVIKFNAINDWAFDNKGAPAITNNMFREVKIAIPELIAQCEGPINTTHENLNLKKKQS